MLLAGQKPPEAALAADKTSVVSAAKTSVVSAAKKAATAATSAATSDISIPSTTPWGGAKGDTPGGAEKCRRHPLQGVVDWIEMLDDELMLQL